MSEELIQRRLQKSGRKVGNYEYYSIGNTNISELKNNKIIPNRNYGKYSNKKPDNLLVQKPGKSDVVVVTVIEHKRPSEFNTDEKKKVALRQCNNFCQVLNSKFGIATDGNETIWINPWHKNPENNYTDEVTREQRSYSVIRNEDKKELSEPFVIQQTSEIDIEKLDDDAKNTLDYVERVISYVNKNNSELKATEEVDPLGLAHSVWQDIYINTQKDPTKCLYNVVELFIFKFLSDLGTLKSPYNFEFLMDMQKKGNTNKEILTHYARNSRKRIIESFPKGDDGTTIINGTIFVDSYGEPVESQATLFVNSLKKYASFGSLRNVKKEFKTKLFETFLKESPDKTRLGQFLTPRKVVRVMVEMSDVENLPDNSRFCDPFCGVGGFLCEPLHKKNRKNDFVPKNGKIEPRITYHGFDKGKDEDEERTIILAKANMLIYLSELIEKYPQLTKEFADIFNSIFHLISNTNLGTLARKIENEEEKYDLILSNPPYITSGVTSVKNDVKEEGLESYYTFGGKGVEGLAIEWIVRNLRKNGRAFVIIPDSVLSVGQNQLLRSNILKKCFLNCIISLPSRTFFTTSKKTYILGVTKKNDESKQQDFPVFTYLVSNIGEELNADRFEIEGKSDLEKAKDLFNAYKGSPQTFPITEIGDPRCKLIPIKLFDTNKIWTIEQWWSKDERVSLGMENQPVILTVEELSDKVQTIDQVVKKAVNELRSQIHKKKIKLVKKELGKILDFPETNSKITKKFCRISRNKGTIPVYASSKDAKSTLGYLQDNLSGVHYYENCLSWNRNGSVGYVFVRDHRFATNEDHRAMTIKDEFKNMLQMEYLKFEIENKLLEGGFSFLNKCGVEKIKEVMIDIPVNDKGEFSIEGQVYLLSKIKKTREIQDNLQSKISEIVEATIQVN